MEELLTNGSQGAVVRLPSVSAAVQHAMPRRKPVTGSTGARPAPIPSDTHIDDFEMHRGPSGDAKMTGSAR